jgi:hypothetical protein
MNPLSGESQLTYAWGAGINTSYFLIMINSRYADSNKKQKVFN